MRELTYYVRGTVSLDALNDIVDGEPAKIYTRNDRLMLQIEDLEDLSADDFSYLRDRIEDRASNRDVILERVR